MARLRVLTDRPLPPRRILGALGLALVALATGLPLVVAAFRLPDIDDEDIDGEDIDGEDIDGDIDGEGG